MLATEVASEVSFQCLVLFVDMVAGICEREISRKTTGQKQKPQFDF